MKMTEQEKARRLENAFIKKANHEYYDLGYTEQHQKLADQYISGQMTDQEFSEKFYQIDKNK